jgi:hypothetical protein
MAESPPAWSILIAHKANSSLLSCDPSIQEELKSLSPPENPAENMMEKTKNKVWDQLVPMNSSALWKVPDLNETQTVTFQTLDGIDIIIPRSIAATRSDHVRFLASLFETIPTHMKLEPSYLSYSIYWLTYYMVVKSQLDFSCYSTIPQLLPKFDTLIPAKALVELTAPAELYGVT